MLFTGNLTGGGGGGGQKRGTGNLTGWDFCPTP